MTEPNRIQFWRRQKGWTLQQLADAGGTTRAQIDKLERGARRLTVDWMVRLAAPLGCDPRSLMSAADASAPLMLPLYKLKNGRRSAVPDRLMPAPYFCRAADCYGVKVTQKDLQPMIRPGMTIIAAPGGRCRADSPVIVLLQDGEVLLGLYDDKDKTRLTLKILHPKPQRRKVPLAAIAALHRIIAVIDDA